MELDELKKSWNELDKQLQKEPIASEEQITRLIARHKAHAHKSLGRLVIIQRFSIGAGAMGLALLMLIWLLMPTFGFNAHLQSKIAAFLIFIAVSILGGMWWDWKTYRCTKAIHVDEMTVAEVSRRTVVFRQWVKHEVVAISVWIVLFNILNYWVMDYYLAAVGQQIIIIFLFVLFDVLVIYTLYRKVIYKHLNDIKKNIEELEELEVED